jgi:hypothetical protein
MEASANGSYCKWKLVQMEVLQMEVLQMEVLQMEAGANGS